MADEIRTMKSFMQGLTFYGGQAIAPIDADVGGIVTIPTDASATYNDRFKLAGSLSPHANDWTFDYLSMTRGATDADRGGVTFRCFNQQKIDLSGLLQLGAAYAPLGSASQRAGVPQLPGDWSGSGVNKFDYAAESLTYMRDFTIWSVEPLTDIDLGMLWSDGIARQSATPNMPNFQGSSGSMTTTQMLSSQTRLFVGDGSLSSRIGWLREIFAQMGGMGETAAAPHIYCTRVISGQFLTTPRQTIAATTSSWANNKFWISFPPSWELLNVGMMTPDDLEYLTYMQRSVLAPGGRSE